MEKQYTPNLSLCEALSELDRLYEDTFVPKNKYRTTEIPKDFIVLDLDNNPLNTTRYINKLNTFIKNAANRPPHDGYGSYHIHHIWPTSLGGPDTADNQIVLTVSEHIKAHGILAEDNPNCLEAQCAAAILYNKYKDKTTIEQRRAIMKAVINGLKISNQGEGNPNYGKTWSDDKKQRHSELMSGKNKNKIIAYIRNPETLEIEAVETTVNLLVKLLKSFGINYKTDETARKEIYKWIWSRPIPSDISNILVKVEYLHPENMKHIDNTGKKIIGIDENTGEIIPTTKDLLDIEAEDVNRSYFKSQYEAAKFIAHKKGGNAKSFVGAVQKSVDANKPSETSYGFFKPRPGQGYYWLSADSSPQYKGWIKKYIRDQKNKLDR